ncbi:epoxide hydrolase [Modestobacter sp. L9-4]|uniref:epoxide hydrolase family protein n=1 Tax=Modestobacter sp. L9-4 TaxID=2851567 RepID=UPI001C76CC76|nr:epoxide hydrolase family protein [Modestobacter sp. L9-4]QXG76713.1 epoxide hydrolase [Modestobacter sp. L9-4]
MTDAAPPPVDQAVLDDLRHRLQRWRRVELTGTAGWDRGTEPGYLADLLNDWATDYDWRPHEERIRALPWEPTARMRLVHQRAADPGATAVVLLHGWPDSVLRYERVLPLLTDLHVVVPALPGYPFAASLPERDLSSADMAAMAEAMAELGHERYVVSGGDIGRGVATALAAQHPDRVAALHLTDVPTGTVLAGEPAALTDDERDLRRQVERWREAEGAYMHEQSTRPHTLAVALGDSPAGLAAWIVEKLRAWSDCGGDVESVFPREELLTWVTAYWVTGAIGTSFAPYARQAPPLGRIDVPTVVNQFPHDLVQAPRSVAEGLFDLRVFEHGSAGGHFAAWECPDEFVGFVRTAVALGASAG